MSARDADPRATVDPRLDTSEREGLTGTAPALLYTSGGDREQITIPPDGRPGAAQPAWRQDFPIDSPQDQYIERRDFTKFLVLISGALTTGQIWIAARHSRPAAGAYPVRRIAPLNAIPVGGSLVFEYPDAGQPCVLVRVAEDAVVAYSQQCTHLSCPVIPQPGRGVLYCPCHEGLFDLRSGRVLAGPPPRPLPRVLIEIRDRAVYATGLELRTS